MDRRDVVIVHDPQPAALIPRLKELGVPVMWRCHVGIDTPRALSRRAWSFLRPYVEPADAYVFSCEAFIWERLDRTRIDLIAPVIDAFSAKNQELDSRAVSAILRVAGLNDRADVAGDPHIHPRGRHTGSRAPPGAGGGRATATTRGSDGAAGLALGPAEGSARGHPGLRRARRALDRRDLVYAGPA